MAYARRTALPEQPQNYTCHPPPTQSQRSDLRTSAIEHTKRIQFWLASRYPLNVIPSTLRSTSLLAVGHFFHSRTKRVRLLDSAFTFMQ